MRNPGTVTTLLLCLCSSLLAQASKPASKPTSLIATVTDVRGLVQMRSNDDQPWQTVRGGMTAGEGAEFRTGPRSSVALTIPPDQRLVLDRLGTVKLIEALRDGKKIKTDIGMKYGRVQYEIEAAGLEHDAVIHSPGSSLAVRGTNVALFNQGFYPISAYSYTGHATFTGTNGQPQGFGGQGYQSSFQDGSGGSGQTALNSTFFDPTCPWSHSDSEDEAILNSPWITGFSFGGTHLFGPPTLPPPTAPGTSLGSLVFQLVWASGSPEIRPTDLRSVCHNSPWRRALPQRRSTDGPQRWPFTRR